MIIAPHRLRWPLTAAIVALLAGLGAGPPADAPRRAQPEDLSQWEWYQEVTLPILPAGNGLVDLVVPPSVFGQAALDLRDLRLADAANKTIPFALRIRTPRNEQTPLKHRTFNRVINPDHSVEISIDLGKEPPQHNEIEVNLAGTGYGRPLRLEGSADSKTWSKILDGVYVVHLKVAGRDIDQRRFTYPPSRFRYLRVQVRPDRVVEKDEPKLQSVEVYHSVSVPGESVTMPASLGPREPGRLYGEYSSAWEIDLGDKNVPCERLSLDVAETDFTRPFTIELVEPGNPSPQVIMSAQLQRQPGQRSASVEINLPQAVATRKLRLTIQDSRNPPLTITAVRFTAAVRQVVFPVSPGLKTPVRLYYGNPKAPHPNYDFAATLPASLDPPPGRAALSGPVSNPAYVPPAKAWTERWPYLVDGVLAIACAVLLGILFVLARTAIISTTPPRPLRDPREG